MKQDASQSPILVAALEYATLGWRVIPLKDGRSKRPSMEGWQRAATCDVPTIEGWWAGQPDRNVGVAMGAASGIVDVECDGPEAEKIFLDLFGTDCPVTPTYQAKRGKHRLFRWRDDLPEPAKNGFKIGELEFRTGNGDKGAQSVFPPSMHPDGVQYTWLVPPAECEVAEFPEGVVAKLWNWLAESAVGKLPGTASIADRARAYLAKVPRVEAGVGGHDRCYTAACRLVVDFALSPDDALPLLSEWMAGAPPHDTTKGAWTAAELRHKLVDALGAAGVRGRLLGSNGHAALPPQQMGTDLEVEARALWLERFKLGGSPAFDTPEEQAVVYRKLWSENKARAAVPANDAAVHAICEAARRYVRDETASEMASKGPNYTALGLERRDGEWWPGQWRAICITSDPKEFKLIVPFAKAPIVFTPAQFDDPKAVHLGVLQTTGSVCLDDTPGLWFSIWKGSKGNKREGIPARRGVMAKLLDDVTYEDSSDEKKRSVIVARWLWRAVEKARVIEDGAAFDVTMRAAKVGSEVFFSFDQVWEEASRSNDKVTRSELSDLAEGLQVPIRRITVNGRRKKVKCLDVKGLELLQTAAGMDGE